MKRLFDFFFSFFGILFLLPVMVVLYVIGLFDTGSPIFKQERVGKNKKPFILYKFRTMNVKAKSVATHLADSSDITKFGAFLRKTKLDELPQLFNVLLGDMSLVGPRPERPVFVKEFNKMLPAYHYRHNVKPGITGFAQIFGKYNTTASDKLVYDLMYIQNCGLKQDLVLILQTIRILFTKSSTEGYSVSEDETDLNRYRVGNISQ